MTEVLTVGTGRCGTAGWTAMLRECGLTATHEGYFGPEGPADRQLVGLQIAPYEQSWMGAPWLDRWKEQGGSRKVILLWRDPVSVVASLLGIGFFTGRPVDDYQRYAHRHCDAWVLWREPIQRAVYFWTTWNRRIMSSGMVDAVQYIEDPNYGAVCDWYGLDEMRMEQAAAKVGRRVNARRRADLTDEEIRYVTKCTEETFSELREISA